MPAAPPFHYVAEIGFDVASDDARRVAVTSLLSALLGRANDPAPIDDWHHVAVDGAVCSIDLQGSAPDLRPGRLRHLADALVAQRQRPTFPDSITIPWSKAR
ncbi:MAG: hypothetical protein H6705_16875 [Myxococcales bacterium]|nr:hypothetical protein [Myxococcales bacterium]